MLNINVGPSSQWWRIIFKIPVVGSGSGSSPKSNQFVLITHRARPHNCISPNVGRYFGLVTGPPPAMEAMEAEATERFRRECSSVANLTRINLIFWIYLIYTLIQTPIENWVHISKIDRLLTDWPSIMSMGFGGNTSTWHLCRAVEFYLNELYTWTLHNTNHSFGTLKNPSV